MVHNLGNGCLLVTFELLPVFSISMNLMVIFILTWLCHLIACKTGELFASFLESCYFRKAKGNLKGTEHLILYLDDLLLVGKGN